MKRLKEGGEGEEDEERKEEDEERKQQEEEREEEEEEERKEEERKQQEEETEEEEEEERKEEEEQRKEEEEQSDLQWTEMGPSWPNCSLVLWTWPMKSMKPSPDLGTPCSGQSVNWNCLTVLDWPS